MAVLNHKKGKLWVESVVIPIIYLHSNQRVRNGIVVADTANKECECAPYYASGKAGSDVGYMPDHATATSLSLDYLPIITECFIKE